MELNDLLAELARDIDVALQEKLSLHPKQPAVANFALTKSYHLSMRIVRNAKIAAALFGKPVGERILAALNDDDLVELNDALFSVDNEVQ
jgi:hypothetical protein